MYAWPVESSNAMALACEEPPPLELSDQMATPLRGRSFATKALGNAPEVSGPEPKSIVPEKVPVIYGLPGCPQQRPGA